MFESISFFNHDRYNTSQPLDIGKLVECMLFYGETTVFANRNIVKQLFLYFGIDETIELIDEGLLKISYSENSAAIHTTSNSNIEYHDAIHFSSPQHTFQIELVKVCQEVTGKIGKGRRIANRIKDLINLKNSENLVLESARELILDQKLIVDSARTVIKDLIPQSINLEDMIFETEKTSSGIMIRSNLDYTQLNELYHKHIPVSHSSITSSLILSHILTTENEIWYASQNLSEISTSKISSQLISQKVDNILNKSSKNAEQLNRFQEFVFDDSRALRDFVNQGKVEIKDLIALLKKAKKFKKWIAGIDADQDLIKNYHKEVTKGTFVDKLPGKTTRWAIFTGASLVMDMYLTGGLATIIGQGLGALDSFVLDKLIRGWKPNQFIEEDILPRLKESD